MTSEFIQAVREIASGDVPADVRGVAQCCILDWTGAAIAGTREPLVEMLFPEIMTGAERPCGLVGRPQRTSPLGAALINGAAGDALDYSDCNRTMNGHATATVFPAALALAQLQGVSGEALLRAFVGGVEAACRVGLLVAPGILETAFHPTAVAGPVGAACAGALLLDLDDERWSHALGIAATQAAGLADAVGTMCKPLHAGTAASAGVLAARLAARGFTGSRGALEPDGAFLASHSARVDPDALARAGGAFLILQTLMKEHAACALTHGSIENMLRIKRMRRFELADIGAIRLQIAASSARVCDIVEPATGLEAKFSVRTVAAMAILGYDTGSLATFGDGLASSVEIASLRERISVEPRDDLDVAVSRAEIELHDGSILESQTDERVADGGLAARRARAHEKFVALTAPFLSAQDAAALEERIFALEDREKIDVRF